MHESRYAGEDKNLASLVTEIRDEVKDFAETRVAMLKAELQEKAAAAKVWGPLAGGALLLLGTAYILVTLAIVSLIAALLPDNPFRWAIGFAVIAVLWGLIGGLFAYLAKKKLTAIGMFPKKTVEVLKADKVWLQQEAKNQI
ncbi:MAG: hypothetical protein QOD84_1879 [Acidobacteriaceae bacterium]|jgi:uncharacterized membrane protein YqjE